MSGRFKFDRMELAGLITCSLEGFGSNYRLDYGGRDP